MQKLVRTFLVVALTSAFAATGLVSAPDAPRAGESLARVQAVHCPSVQLKHWKESSQQEKLAFLFGFATMLEMEKEWQADRPLSVNYSLNSIWARGLDGLTLGQMSAAVDDYIARNPDKLEQSVMGTLGRLFVSPKLSPEERTEAAAHYREIKGNK